MTESTSPGPTLAIVLNRDLLFGSRIRSALASLGLEARFVSTAEQFVGALSEQAVLVAIGVIDMNGAVSWDVIREALSRADGGVVRVRRPGAELGLDATISRFWSPLQ